VRERGRERGKENEIKEYKRSTKGKREQERFVLIGILKT